jgi:hypothetical protein
MTNQRKNDDQNRHFEVPAETERERFVDLAYRLVRCTEPDEQHRLKDEVVRKVRARRQRTRSEAEIG